MERLDLRRLRRPVDVYFVRHGESEGNRTGKILGRMDLGLSELGEEHARAAGRFFAAELGTGSDTGGPSLYLATSPLQRCRQTAARIREEAGLPEPEVREEFLELDTGVFSGKGLGEIAREMPEAFASRGGECCGAEEAVDGIASL